MNSDYTTVAELRQINLPARADELDASNHDTPDAWKEWVAGMKEMEARLEGNYLPNNATQDGATGILERFEQGDRKQMRVRFPQVTPHVQISFTGIFLEYTIGSNAEQLATLTSRVRVLGQPLFSLWSS